jgi:hypothetical protein
MMLHTIEFRVSGLVQLEMPGKVMPVQVLMERGTRVRARIKPYVIESDKGPIEVADLLSDDGSAARAVRFAHFRFIDQ